MYLNEILHNTYINKMDILKEIDPTLLNKDGELKPGVQIIQADDGRVIAEGKEQPNLHGKDPERFPSSNLQPGDPLYLDESFSGDYCEFRDLLLQKTRWKMVEAMKRLTYPRLALLREHLLQAAAYQEDFKAVCLEVALIATRVLASDWETDMDLDDTEFDVGKMEIDSDEEEVEWKEEVKLPEPQAVSACS